MYVLIVHNIIVFRYYLIIALEMEFLSLVFLKCFVFLLWLLFETVVVFLLFFVDDDEVFVFVVVVVVVVVLVVVVKSVTGVCVVHTLTFPNKTLQKFNNHFVITNYLSILFEQGRRQMMFAHIKPQLSTSQHQV